MMGERTVMQEALFYEFSLERHVPADHLLRSIDRFVDLSGIRAHLRPFYSEIGRPSIDPELMIRMLIVGYCFGIRSERRLCEEVHLNLAYRWFCRLGLDGDVPDHSTFSKNRHGRFRDSDLLRELFETTVAPLHGRGAGRRRRLRGRCQPDPGRRQPAALACRATRACRRRLPSRAVREYLAVLDDAAFGAATPVTPKFISPSDPASRWTGANGGPRLLRLRHQLPDRPRPRRHRRCRGDARAIRQAEVGAARTMIERTAGPLRPLARAAGRRHRLWLGREAAWLVHERGIEPHIPVFDKSERDDGTFERGRLHLRPRARQLHLPGRQGAEAVPAAPSRRRARRRRRTASCATAPASSTATPAR